MSAVQHRRTSPKDFFVIANRGADSDRLTLALELLATRASVEVQRTNSAEECADRIGRLGDRHLVIAGGDGTLTAMVNLLRTTGMLDDVILGLLPMGTGNDFARTLGVPLDPQEAARVLLDGTARRLDLIVDDRGKTVINAVHGGIGADAAEASIPFKPALGPAAYPLGAALAGLSSQAAAVKVHVDDEVAFDGDALMVGVGNGATIGGGTPLVPDAEPDDGLLDVVIVATETLGRKIGFVSALRSGEHTLREDVATFRGREVRVEGKPLRYNADGEISSPRHRASFRVEPAAWTMIAPSAGSHP